MWFTDLLIYLAVIVSLYSFIKSLTTYSIKTMLVYSSLSYYSYLILFSNITLPSDALSLNLLHYLYSIYVLFLTMSL